VIEAAAFGQSTEIVFLESDRLAQIRSSLEYSFAHALQLKASEVPDGRYLVLCEVLIYGFESADLKTIRPHFFYIM